MAQPERTCRDRKNKPNGIIDYPGTYDLHWKMYNHLIGAIPEDVLVTSYCLGTHWTYVEAECGCGVALTVSGGAKRTVKQNLVGLPLYVVAEMAKSWCFEEATIGVAALNAWYGRREALDDLGACVEERSDPAHRALGPSGAFAHYHDAMAGKNVVAVGHFPRVEALADHARLTVLERNPSSPFDTPDPACEYILPHADFAFITGTTLTNKTLPRLLDLAPRKATTVLVGPSTVMSPFLFSWGVTSLSGSTVTDVEALRFGVQNGAGQLFGTALQMVSATAPGEQGSEMPAR